MTVKKCCTGCNNPYDQNPECTGCCPDSCVNALTGNLPPCHSCCPEYCNPYSKEKACAGCCLEACKGPDGKLKDLFSDPVSHPPCSGCKCPSRCSNPYLTDAACTSCCPAGSCENKATGNLLPCLSCCPTYCDLFRHEKACSGCCLDDCKDENGRLKPAYSNKREYPNCAGCRCPSNCQNPYDHDVQCTGCCPDGCSNPATGNLAPCAGCCPAYCNKYSKEKACKGCCL